MGCLLLFFPQQTLAGSGPKIDAVVIHGRFFKGESEIPLPGALVALYDGTNGLLVGQTRTTEAGRFVLRVPGESGFFFIVATKDMMSARRDFQLSAGTPIPGIDIKYEEEKQAFLEEALANRGTLPVITFATGLLSALLVTLMKKAIDTRRLFNIQIGQAKHLCVEIDKRREALTKLIQRHKHLSLSDTSERPRLEECFATLVGSVARYANELAGGELESAVVYARRGERGVHDFYRLRQSLSEICELTSGGRLSSGQWEDFGERITRLVENPLVRN